MHGACLRRQHVGHPLLTDIISGHLLHCCPLACFTFLVAAGHEFGSGMEDASQDQHMSLSDATERGSQFVEKDTNKISQW